MIFWLMVSG